MDSMGAITLMIILTPLTVRISRKYSALFCKFNSEKITAIVEKINPGNRCIYISFI